MTIDQAIDQALAFHKAGKFAEAEQLYRQVLAVSPENETALHHLALIAQQFGHPEIAVELLTRLARIAPSEEVLNNLGATLRGLRRFGEALEAFDRAIRIRPELAALHSNRAGTLWDMKRTKESLVAYRRAIEL